MIRLVRAGIAAVSVVGSIVGGLTSSATAAPTSTYSTSSVDVTFMGKLAAPGAPTTTVAGTAGNTTVALTWNTPASTGGSSITDYVVQYSSDSGSSWTTFADGTSTTASATVTGLTNGTSYTFQVAATNSVGTGSYSTSSSAVTPVAATCATGGECTVGVSSGAGGGIVFYYSSTHFESPGSTCNPTCHYLEAAPTTGSSAWTDVTMVWATLWNKTKGVNNGDGADGTAIGTGYQNTSDIVTQPGQNYLAAAVAAHAYRGPNSLTDWFLPSKDELHQLYLARGYTSLGLGVGSVWSSSEFNNSNAWRQDFLWGLPSASAKGDAYYVRPVRAG